MSRRKRSRFWGSFWGETGKNTGKWVSNKVFGSGWSTPYSIETKRRDTIDAQSYIDSIDKQKSEQKIKAISGNTLEEIKQEIEDTFILLKLNQNNKEVSSSSLKFKIRSGIKSLHILGFSDYAEFYRKEYTKFLVRSWIKWMFQILLGIIFLFFMLLIAKGKLRF